MGIKAQKKALALELVSKELVVSLDGHFARLCREFDLYEVKKK
jgi:hypothetical protein